MEQQESPRKIRSGLKGIARAVPVVALCACATAPAGEPESGREPITIHVDNKTSRVVTVERIVAMQGSRGSTAFGEARRQGQRPITQRVGLVNGESRRTLTVPWHPSRLAHELLWLEGVVRVATDSETLGPGQNRMTYLVEECRGARMNACVDTHALHLPPGAEVELVIDTRHEARMYYEVPARGP